MTAKEWIAVLGIVLSLIGAAVAYGEMSGNVEDAREEIRLLREDMRAINHFFVRYVQSHERGER